MKIKKYILMFCLLSLGLTACGKEKWEEIDTLGDINIDPNDTESIISNPEKFTEEYIEYKIIDLTDITEKENTEIHTLIIHECKYYSQYNNIVLKGMIHNLTEDHGKEITLQIFDKWDNIVKTANLVIKDEADADVGFSLDAKLDGEEYDVENISKIKIFAN